MTEQPTLSEQDKADIAGLGLPPEDTTVRCLLTIWAEVLSNVGAVGSQRIPVNVAAKVVASWPWLTFQETAIYHQLYHRVLGECGDLVIGVIADNPGATAWTAELDAENNHPLYKEILVGWHMLLEEYENDWDAEAEDSQIWLPVIADARAFFFSQMGFAGHLDSIGFKLDNDEFLEAVAKAQEVEGE